MKIKTLISIAVVSLGFSNTVWSEAPYKSDEKTILLYHFDEKIGELPKDSSSLKNHFKKGPKASGSKGVFNSAMKYSNNFNSIKPLTGVEKIKNSGKVEFWIKPDEKTIDRWGGDQIIISKNDGGNNPGDFNIGFRINPIANGGGNFFLLMEDGKGKYRKLSTPNLIKNSQWFHVAVSWDSKSTPTITIDEKVQPLQEGGKNKSYNGPIFTAKNSFLAGVANGPKDGSILLDELRITSIAPPNNIR
jgi:Concanavalin A-like lectin/glucanases superfamily